MSDVNVTIYDRQLDHLLNSPAGAVGAHMRKIAVLIYAGAVRMAGRKSGEIVRKMYWKHGRRGPFQYVEVGSAASHARMHHDGTRPHQIMPETGRLLRFNVGGRIVYARKVLHPGTRPNPFLTTPMRRAVRR